MPVSGAETGRKSRGEEHSADRQGEASAAADSTQVHSVEEAFDKRKAAICIWAVEKAVPPTEGCDRGVLETAVSLQVG